MTKDLVVKTRSDSPDSTSRQRELIGAAALICILANSVVACASICGQQCISSRKLIISVICLVTTSMSVVDLCACSRCFWVRDPAGGSKQWCQLKRSIHRSGRGGISKPSALSAGIRPQSLPEKAEERQKRSNDQNVEGSHQVLQFQCAPPNRSRHWVPTLPHLGWKINKVIVIKPVRHQRQLPIKIKKTDEIETNKKIRFLLVNLGRLPLCLARWH